MKNVTSEAAQYMQAEQDASEFAMLVNKLEQASKDGVHITKEEARILLYQILES